VPEDFVFSLAVFAKAASVGFAIAAPVGPMGLMCIRRTLTQGPRSGLAIGAGIATGDAIYGMIAALGLVSVSRFMLTHDKPLHLTAGLFLLYLAWRTLAAQPEAADAAQMPARTLPSRAGPAYGGAVLLTLTNPQTIVMFAALFAALTPPGGFAADVAAATVAGVFSGSMLWWCLLVAMVAAARHALGARVRRLIDRVAGLVLGLFGVVEIRRAL
jgi:threonine/homoserine/homoserine lactone efflux protein